MINRCLVVGLTLFTLAACAPDEAPDFCGDHALFHAEHVNESAKLTVTMSADGRVDSELQLPVPGIGEQQVTAMLRDATKVYTLETATECSAPQVDVDSGQGTVRATYSSECGIDNKLGQVNVLLFGSLPDLDEVEVRVTTAVTQKHFVIHRQCASAIFRFE